MVGQCRKSAIASTSSSRGRPLQMRYSSALRNAAPEFGLWINNLVAVFVVSRSIWKGLGSNIAARIPGKAASFFRQYCLEFAATRSSGSVILPIRSTRTGFHPFCSRETNRELSMARSHSPSARWNYSRQLGCAVGSADSQLRLRSPPVRPADDRPGSSLPIKPRFWRCLPKRVLCRGETWRSAAPTSRCSFRAMDRSK